MKITMLLFCPILIVAFASCKARRDDQQKEEAFGTGPSFSLMVGTYTGKGSEGIYQVDFNPETGSLGNARLVAETENPSYLAISKDGKRVYAVNELDSGLISFFRRDEGGDQLMLADQESVRGSYPCYISLNESEDLLAVANYGTGNLVVYKVNEGTLDDSPSVRQHQGNGPVTDRQEGPHAHFSRFGRDGDFLYAIDLGIDEVVAYPVDNSGNVGEGHTALKLEGGDGPRHMVFRPGKDQAFIINELSNSVVSVRVDPRKGSFEVIDRQSTLPEDFQGESYCADIHMSDDGKFLYASNRGHNSISIFEVEEDGSLQWLGAESTKGDWPRNFVITSNGNHLLVANQRSDNIVVFRVNKESGLLTPLEQEIRISQPVCLKFM